jgi:SAM-dependent methyltransferase
VLTQARPIGDPLDDLCVPGGGARLWREGNALLGPGGRRYPIEDGIVRMLPDVDPHLAAELTAQQAALDVYTDERLLMTRHERTVARIVVEEMLGVPVGAATILDAGCGIGLLGRLYPSIGLYGLDISFPLLCEARTGYRARVEGSADRLPFDDATFDAVLAVNMLHHVPAPAPVLSEFARVLRPGGVLVTADPRQVRPVELAKRMLRRHNPAYASTHRAFEVEQYQDLLRAGGTLRLEELRRVGLLALLGAGGLDALHLSRWLPAGSHLLGTLERFDHVLGGLPAMRQCGLNLVARARRR